MSYKEIFVGSQNLYAIKTINNLEESLKSRASKHNHLPHTSAT